VPDYLGSKSTFTLGRFGGHAGRTLLTGDILHLSSHGDAAKAGATLAPELIPAYRTDWDIGVLYGPHGAPDFFTEQDMENFFATAWEVHYNSSRTGVRLIGPKPQWARADGGEAGLHPSNIHDNAYAIGAIDFTGDMPVILGRTDRVSVVRVPCGNREPSSGRLASPLATVRFHRVDRKWAAVWKPRPSARSRRLALPRRSLREFRAEATALTDSVLYRQAGTATTRSGIPPVR
jgi:urea carboxylase